MNGGLLVGRISHSGRGGLFGFLRLGACVQFFICLMAVGRSKLEIVLQFLTENILVAIPAAAASLGMTALLADKVGAYLVSQTANNIIGLSVTIHFADIAAVYGIGVLILILAVLLAAVTVIRLKPREILSQMD